MNAKYLSILVLFAGLFTFGCANKSTQKETKQAENISKETQKQTKKEKQTMVLISTSMGDMKAVLYNETPAHRDNFIKLAKEGYFNGLLFHRVIDGFMVQGGDPDSKNAPKGKQLGQGGPSYTIPAEFNQNIIPIFYRELISISSKWNCISTLYF